MIVTKIDIILIINFFEGYAFEYETFWDNCTTPSGDKVVAFGYYGHD
jgi:hypothetical protein